MMVQKFLYTIRSSSDMVIDWLNEDVSRAGRVVSISGSDIDGWTIYYWTMVPGGSAR